MAVTLEQTTKLVDDVQVAHRLLVAYYERLLARLEAVARELDLSFWYWEPLETSRPCRSQTPPTKNWLWDMLPLYASLHVYRRIAGENIRRGDVNVLFEVYADDGFSEAKRKLTGRGKPDPLTLPRGDAVIIAEVYVAKTSVRKPWDDEWGDLDSPDQASEVWKDVGCDVYARCVKTQLAEFMRDPSEFRNRVAALIAEARRD